MLLTQSINIKCDEDALLRIITKITEGIPSESKLNLPKLKKISVGNNQPKLKLPKLKKV